MLISAVAFVVSGYYYFQQKHTASMPNKVEIPPHAPSLCSEQITTPADTVPLISWDRHFGNIQRSSTGTVVAAVYISGRTKDQYVRLEDAVICSKLAGDGVQMVVGIGDNSASLEKEDFVEIQDLNPMPPGALVRLVAFIVPALAPKEFLARWQNIDFIAKYNGVFHRLEFDFSSSFPGVVGPRTTKRGS
jgi:hypothetical protein